MDRKELHRIATTRTDVDDALKMATSPHMVLNLLGEMGGAYKTSVDIATSLLLAKLDGKPDTHPGFNIELLSALRKVHEAYKAVLAVAAKYEDMRANCQCAGCHRRRQAEAAREGRQ